MGWVAVAACLLLSLGISLRYLGGSSSAPHQERATNLAENATVPSEKPEATPHPAAEDAEHAKTDAPPAYTAVKPAQQERSPSQRLAINEHHRGEQYDRPRRTVEVFPAAEPTMDFQRNLTQPTQSPQPNAVQPAVSCVDWDAEDPDNQPQRSEDNNLIVSVLNVLTRNLVPQQAEVQFSSDEEGTINIDISKNIVRQKL